MDPSWESFPPCPVNLPCYHRTILHSLNTNPCQYARLPVSPTARPAIPWSWQAAIPPKDFFKSLPTSHRTVKRFKIGMRPSAALQHKFSGPRRRNKNRRAISSNPAQFAFVVRSSGQARVRPLTYYLPPARDNRSAASRDRLRTVGIPAQSVSGSKSKCSFSPSVLPTPANCSKGCQYSNNRDDREEFDQREPPPPRPIFR